MCVVDHHECVQGKTATIITIVASAAHCVAIVMEKHVAGMTIQRSILVGIHELTRARRIGCRAEVRMCVQSVPDQKARLPPSHPDEIRKHHQRQSTCQRHDRPLLSAVKEEAKSDRSEQHAPQKCRCAHAALPVLAWMAASYSTMSHQECAGVIDTDAMPASFSAPCQPLPRTAYPAARPAHLGRVLR